MVNYCIQTCYTNWYCNSMLVIGYIDYSDTHDTAAHSTNIKSTPNVKIK